MKNYMCEERTKLKIVIIGRLGAGVTLDRRDKDAVPKQPTATRTRIWVQEGVEVL